MIILNNRIKNCILAVTTRHILAVTKCGLTLVFDPRGKRNRCFYQCLSEHLGVAVSDVIEVLKKYMLTNRVVPVERSNTFESKKML